MEQREKIGKIAGVVGIVVNVALAILKLLAGVFSGSIAVVADSVNNFSDSATSLITFIGFKVAGKPADREHPYGHARFEYLSGFLVSVVIAFLGLQLAKSSFEKILSSEPPRLNVFVIMVLVLSMFAKSGLWVFYSKIARNINSLTLKAAASDSRNDLLVTSSVLISMVIYKLTGFSPDGIAGLIVSAVVLAFGIKLIVETASPLIGSAISEDMVNKISELVLRNDGIIGIHDLAVHSYGHSRLYASVHCEVSADVDIMISHDLIDNIERDAFDELGVALVIHLDPVSLDDEKTILARHSVEGVIMSISSKLCIHDFRAVYGVTHTNILFDVVVPIEFEMSDDELVAEIMRKVRIINNSWIVKVVVDHSFC